MNLQRVERGGGALSAGGSAYGLEVELTGSQVQITTEFPGSRWAVAWLAHGMLTRPLGISLF